MLRLLIFVILFPSLVFSQLTSNVNPAETARPPFSYKDMVKLAELPFDCINQEYPNKLNQVLTDATHLKSPSELHPIFYGCFDWHSSVHGFWLLTKGMNEFPKTKLEKKVIKLLNEKLTEENVAKELAYFNSKLNKSFERTYGWAWVLKLHTELHQSKHNEIHKWTDKLAPLTDFIVKSYKEFLPKLVYPIRVGEHTNTAFGLSLAIDYTHEVKDTEFASLIVQRANEFYSTDMNCPLTWEPSGFDFISPCLQEAHLMSKLLTKQDFKSWVEKFMPQLLKPDFSLEPGKVLDRSDGKLVHLDGLNFSRAWCLYGISNALENKNASLHRIADNHINSSYEQVLGSDYMGSHWLASFLVYAIFEKD